MVRGSPGHLPVEMTGDVTKRRWSWGVLESSVSLNEDFREYKDQGTSKGKSLGGTEGGSPQCLGRRLKSILKAS